ncbi:MAG: CPBP family intramembrane glutamic endopeptidase [Actinomycetes bacterium]
MTNCPSCGAHAPASASWCGQCYQRLATAPASGMAAGGSSGTVMGGVDRFGIALTSPPAPPFVPNQEEAAASTPDRFGIVRTPAEVAAETTSGAVSTLAPPTTFAPGRVPAAPMFTPPARHDLRTGSLGAWGWGSTGMTVIAAILLGGFVQFVFYLLNKHYADNTATEVNTAIAILVVFYAVVGAVVIQRVTAGGVRLLWSTGKPVEGVLIGMGLGIGLGLAALGVNSAITGHLATDPWAQLMTSEGDAPHILVAILLTMIAAPLVEETLFRGLFAESLRSKGLTPAIWLSGLAFAFWHWRFSELRYYSLMGAMFAILYFKRGLVCSMTTHACFNGTLTVVAIILALHPGKTFTYNGVSLTAPRGWHQTANAQGVPAQVFGLDGPSDANIGMMVEPYPANSLPSLNDPAAVRRLQSVIGGSPYANQLDVSRIRQVDLPAGHAIEIPVEVSGYKLETVAVQAHGKLLVLIFHSSGSAKAEHDFQQMLQSLRVA